MVANITGCQKQWEFRNKCAKNLMYGTYSHSRLLPFWGRKTCHLTGHHARLVIFSIYDHGHMLIQINQKAPLRLGGPHRCRVKLSYRPPLQFRCLILRWHFRWRHFKLSGSLGIPHPGLLAGSPDIRHSRKLGSEFWSLVFTRGCGISLLATGMSPSPKQQGSQ